MEKEHLYRKIYNDLLMEIETGNFPPGSRVPSEKELAEQYNVSRITSKKALEMLAEQKRIERMPGKGSYVLEQDGGRLESEKAYIPLAGSDGEDIARRGNSGNKSSQDEYGRDGNGQEENDQKENSQDGNRRMIGVILDSFGVSYGCGLVNGIEHECGKQGFHMVLKCTYGSMEEEVKAVDDLIALGVRGIILMCVQGENYNANVLRLSLEHFPIVLVDRELTGLPIPCVSTDNYQAARDLMELLIEKGHTGIGFLSHPFIQTSSVAARFSGYLDTMLEHGLMTNEDIWLKNLGNMISVSGEDREEEGTNTERIQNFVGEHPEITGFFAVDQILGSMVYKILRRMGMEKEKEVVFFDGPDEIWDSDLTFDYVVQNENLIGVRAVQFLADLMEGREVPKKSFVPYKVVRGIERKQEN